MRLKALLTAALPAVLFVCSSSPVNAQVAPAAREGGLPIGIGVGMSGYNLDYGPGRWMEGGVVRGSIGLYHGFGLDVSARAIYMNTPSDLTRMQQNTFLGGVFYEYPKSRFRPFVRGAGGLGTIEFPSNNPKYTRDSYSVIAPSGGVEFALTRKVFLRGEYEYQIWQDFRGDHALTPQGVTAGVTYYLRGRHIGSGKG